jgi:hypothetical protein
MTTSQAHAIGKLPELTWRGLDPVPCEDASYDFTHEQVERRYAYIDGVGHDHTGRGPIRVNARLHFVNTIQPNLYPHTWEEWRAAFFDGAAGELVHPELGAFDARVLHGSVHLTAQNRAGVTVEVLFVETIRDPDRPPGDFPVLSLRLQQSAAAADAACVALGIAYPRVVDPPSKSLLEAIKSIEGELTSSQLSALGAISQVIGSVRAMADAVERLSPVNRALGKTSPWPAQHNLGIVEAGLIELSERLERSARPVSTRVMERATTLDAFARDVGNTLDEVIGLNPTALARPSVRRGTRLRYYGAS